MDDQDLRQRLQRECEGYGSQRKWARAHGMSAQYVSEVLCGTRTPGPKVLTALGLMRTQSYEQAPGEEPPQRRVAAE